MVSDDQPEIFAGEALTHREIAAFLAFEDDQQLAVLDSQVSFLAADLDRSSGHIGRIGPIGLRLNSELIGLVSGAANPPDRVHRHLAGVQFLHRFGRKIQIVFVDFSGLSRICVRLVMHPPATLVQFPNRAEQTIAAFTVNLEEFTDR